MSKENKKVVEFQEQEENETTEIHDPEENETTEIQAVKKGPVAWFKGLKTWQKVVLGGTVVGVTVYGGVKLHKVLTKNSKQVGEVIPMDVVTDIVEEFSKVE